ncbi:sulfite exporter TauE/SafE family protein [[Clostridium] polysaccharolyticum]|uniref:Probable membrane transporter protein n=1 Tax=[Clostridium] polysaccharolyticum TaxID=29364 RepID=A0A1H9ZB22_9FIRM|nr:sulfite exporter TauE/SafE family protein [[Clostridium] polysaccharolyticum]SES78270.1 Uncharacterized membrane protein YfcA [[Clostridium] polysaccharolyticum]
MEQSNKTSFWKRKDIRIQCVMYIIVFLIWFFGYMRSIGFGSYIKNYPIPLTMVFGGFVSGFTICGGGAVSFPIFCKALKLDPMMARDFALGIQSFGMTCATITIIVKKIPIEKTVAIFCTIGSFFGLVLGNIFVVPYISSGSMKILFSIMTAAFGTSLFAKTYLFRKNQKPMYDNLKIPDTRAKLLLIVIGIFGGIFTSVLGTGADILAFSMATILFRLNEKVLNPTSDIIMALSSIMGLLMRMFLFDGVNSDAARSFPLAIPIVIIMAPFGAVVASKIKRLAVVKFLLFFIVVDVASTFRSVHFDDQRLAFTIICFSVLLLFYLLLAKTSAIIDKSEEKV